MTCLPNHLKQCQTIKAWLARSLSIRWRPGSLHPNGGMIESRWRGLLDSFSKTPVDACLKFEGEKGEEGGGGGQYSEERRSIKWPTSGDVWFLNFNRTINNNHLNFTIIHGDDQDHLHHQIPAMKPRDHNWSGRSRCNGTTLASTSDMLYRAPAQSLSKGLTLDGKPPHREHQYARSVH